MCKSLKCHTSPPPNPWGLSPPRPQTTVPLGTWNFRNLKQELLLNGKRNWWARRSHLITWKIQQAMQNDAIRTARIHPAFIPATRLKRSYGKISSPFNYRDLWEPSQPALSCEHIEKDKAKSRKPGRVRSATGLMWRGSYLWPIPIHFLKNSYLAARLGGIKQKESSLT